MRHVRQAGGAGSRRARHLVLLGPLADLDDGLARRHRRHAGLLSDQPADHRVRHPVLLGRPHDHDVRPLHRQGAVRRGPPDRPRPRRARPEDVEDQGKRDGPPRPGRGSTAPTRCASRSRRWPRPGGTCRSTASAWRGTGPSATKLWNAARFVQMHLDGSEPPLGRLDTGALALPERWILAELERTTAAVNRSWESYRFDEGCRAALPVRVERLLRLVHGDGQARARRRTGSTSRPRMAAARDERRRAGGRARGAYRSAQAAAPGDAVHHRGDRAAPRLRGPADHDTVPGRRRVAGPTPMRSRLMAAFQAVVQETRSYRHLVGLAAGHAAGALAARSRRVSARTPLPRSRPRCRAWRGFRLSS